MSNYHNYLGVELTVQLIGVYANIIAAVLISWVGAMFVLIPTEWKEKLKKGETIFSSCGRSVFD